MLCVGSESRCLVGQKQNDLNAQMSKQWMGEKQTKGCWGPDEDAWRNRRTPHAIALETPGMWTSALEIPQIEVQRNKPVK